MGASALIFSVMMPCKGHKKRVPNFGNDCFSHFCGFPMSGTTIFGVFACSQHWEQLFFLFLGVPDIGNDDFCHFQLFPRSGTSVLESIWRAQDTLKNTLIGMDATNSQHFARLMIGAYILACAQSHDPNQSPCAVFYDQLLLLFIERELFLG